MPGGDAVGPSRLACGWVRVAVAGCGLDTIVLFNARTEILHLTGRQAAATDLVPDPDRDGGTGVIALPEASAGP